jgi:hypothetical protein
LDGSDGRLVPTPFVAVTVKVYETFVRLAIVTEVCVPGTVDDAPPREAVTL